MNEGQAKELNLTIPTKASEAGSRAVTDRAHSRLEGLVEGGQNHLREPLRPTRTVWHRLGRNPIAVGGTLIIIVLALSAFFAPQLAPYRPFEIDLTNLLSPPSGNHWLGTDELGRDLLSRLLYAGRISLFVGVSTAVVAVAFGGVVGLFAGYYGGVVDYLTCRMIDTLLSFPILALGLVIAGFMTITPVSLVFIIASLSWMSPARLVRAEVLSLRQRDFVEAARAVGAGNLRIIFYHLLPNTVAPALVTVTLLVAHAILIESALSFLGFGIQPPDPSWGNMLYTAQRYVRDAPWMGIFPGLMIALTVMSINFLGDGLREAVDPRLRV